MSIHYFQWHDLLDLSKVFYLNTPLGQWPWQGDAGRQITWAPAFPRAHIDGHKGGGIITVETDGTTSFVRQATFGPRVIMTGDIEILVDMKLGTCSRTPPNFTNNGIGVYSKIADPEFISDISRSEYHFGGRRASSSSLRRVRDSSGTVNTSATASTQNYNNVGNQRRFLRFQMLANGSTNFKHWLFGDPEPASWSSTNPADANHAALSDGYCAFSAVRSVSDSTPDSNSNGLNSNAAHIWKIAFADNGDSIPVNGWTSTSGTARIDPTTSSKKVFVMPKTIFAADSADVLQSPPHSYQIEVGQSPVMIQSHAFDPEKWIGLHFTSTAYGIGDIVFSEGSGTGLVLECTTAGTSGATAPAWNSTVGDTTADGTAVFTTLGVVDELAPKTNFYIAG